MPKKTRKTKTTTNSNKNKNTQKVVVNINSDTSNTKKKTTKKGVQSFTKGNSYLGGTAMRGVNYPSTTVINNMPSPPMMFPQMETNRISAIENGMNNIRADIQGLYGRISAPTEDEVNAVLPRLTNPLATSIIGSQSSVKYPSVKIESSTTSTPTFGGSTSSDDSSGGNMPVPTETMNDATEDFQTPQTMSMSVPTRMRDVLSDRLDHDDESIGSARSATSSIGGLATQFSRMSLSRVPETEVQVPSSTVPTTIDVNPSSKVKPIKVKPEVKSEIKTEPISPPSDGAGTSRSVNQRTPNKRELKQDFERIIESLDYIDSKDVIMTQGERNKTRKKLGNELSQIYSSLHPNAKKTPKHITKLQKLISNKLVDDA